MREKISNRYLKLAFPIAKASESAGMGNLYAGNADLPKYMSAYSRWIFASSSRDRLRSLARKLKREGLRPVPEGKRPMLVHSVGENQLKSILQWTDDFTDLRDALSFPMDLESWIDVLRGTPDLKRAEPKGEGTAP